MKITFQPTEIPEMGNQSAVNKSETRRSERSYASGALFGLSRDRNWIAGNGSAKEKPKSMTELQQQLGNVDVGIMQDYKTLLSNTMSAEDYAKLEKEGFDFSAMDPETAVTIVDKIKAELARSGQHIAGYTDDMDHETLAAALGSEALASAVSESFQAADIPLTEENVEGVKKAWDMTTQLSQPTEGSYQYMVDNGMEPEVWNFYLSQNSGAAQRSGGQQGGSVVGQPRFYAEDIQGYYTESANGNIGSELQGEIDKLLVREGLVTNEENRQAAETLLKGGLPITKENLLHLQELQGVEFPVTEATFANAAAAAIAEGKEPICGNLAKSQNIYDKAAQVLDYYWNDVEQVIDLDNITARRQLEEIRLRMSAEVNVKLIKSGFAIDTAPMEQLIEALRQAESEVAAKYFPQDVNAVAKYELYCGTNEVVRELPGLPARTLGTMSVQETQVTLSEFHAEGKALQESYIRAQESYETLMTAPRKDLGDSIRKAFANVDAILQDMGLDLNEKNRRAVRILGYNRMTINTENIERVQLADEKVQNVVEKMTPASTLRMIREGMNPLEMSFEELETYFDSLPEAYEETTESYSRFLYGLEQNKQITEEERTSYIGIYRMLHQIDASDGAAIGALVNVGAEIHFSNLLSAVRSGKFKSMDVSVTESFGGTVEVLRKGESISEQIAKGFVKNTNELLTEVSYSEESEEAYRQMELEQIRQAATVDAESVEMLIRGRMPASAGNLLAAQALADSSYNPFKEWKMKKEQLADADNENGKSVLGETAESVDSELVEKLTDKETFRAEYQEMIATLEQEVEEMSLQAESSVDVRNLKLLHKQFSVASHMAREEEYLFPMYIGEELTKVHLTLNRSEEQKGYVTVAVDLSAEERVEGHFHAEFGKITGFFVGNTENAVMKLNAIADKFSDAVQNGTENEWVVDNLPVVNKQENVISQRRQASVNKEVPGGEEYKDVDNTELYRIAKVFLEAVQGS